MAILTTPLTLHPNFEKRLKVGPFYSLAFCSLPTRKYLPLASAVIDFAPHKITECSTEKSSAPKCGILSNAVSFLESMDLSNPDECSETIGLILQSCRKYDNLQLGLQLHGRLIVIGVELCAYLSSQLLEMYCTLSSLDDARMFFDKMSDRNVFSWTSMIGLYCKLGDYEKTIELFYSMTREGIRPDHFIFPKVFKACSELKNYRAGIKVYDYMLSIGFEGNPFVKKSLLDMFIKCGRMKIARHLFEEMEFKDIVVWNMMISGYASTGDFAKALKYFDDMKIYGVEPDQVTWNAIISGFAQKGQLNEASSYFLMGVSENFKPNVVSWSALIAGNEQNGCSYQALNVFRQMIVAGIKPNSITITSVISSCTDLSLLQIGKEIHCYCIKREELDSNLLVGNSLIDFYAKCRSLESACKKFSRINQKDIISWNSMLYGFALKGCREEAIKLLDEMESQGVEPDIITWNGLVTGFTQNGDGKTGLEFFQRMVQTGIDPNTISLSGSLAGCSQIKDLNSGKVIHAYVIRNQIDQSTGIGSALISMYSGCDCLKHAHFVFRELSNRDIVLWNSLITAFAQNGQGVFALDLLRELNSSSVKPNTVTMISALPACSRLAALRQGKEIHQFIIRLGLTTSTFIWNALIDMYGRCGSIRTSREVFDLIPNRDIVSWNIMIAVYGMHGLGMNAVSLFRCLQACEGLKPNHVTFTNLLSACSHSGLIDEGWEYFGLMQNGYALEPGIEQYACMVDLMARAGQFNESLDFIKKMPYEPNAPIWGSLLGACRVYKNPVLAEYAAKCLFELEPQNSGTYILLANIYASVGRWEDAAKTRLLMKERKVIKAPGCSWIEVKRKVHSFIVGDTSHPLMDEIRAKMESLYSDIKGIGYVPDTNYVLQKVEEDEKEFSLCGHSEKLALAFGLISTAKGSPLRIIKNLRICGDCHSATKYISKLEDREIIMRDNYRFHHFVNGGCSCGDYW